MPFRGGGDAFLRGRIGSDDEHCALFGTENSYGVQKFRGMIGSGKGVPDANFGTLEGVQQPDSKTDCLGCAFSNLDKELIGPSLSSIVV